MNEAEVFVQADRALNGVVAQIRDGQRSMPLPPTFLRRDSASVPTLREIINYHAYDDAWVPDMLAGKTMQEAGADNHQGDLLGSDPKGNFAAIVERACAAAEGFTDFDRRVHLSFGEFSAREYFWQINNFRGLR